MAPVRSATSEVPARDWPSCRNRASPWPARTPHTSGPARPFRLRPHDPLYRYRRGPLGDTPSAWAERDRTRSSWTFRSVMALVGAATWQVQATSSRRATVATATSSGAVYGLSPLSTTCLRRVARLTGRRLFAGRRAGPRRGRAVQGTEPGRPGSGPQRPASSLVHVEFEAPVLTGRHLGGDSRFSVGPSRASVT